MTGALARRRALPHNGRMNLQRATFGALADGRAVDLFTLTNDRGTTVKITNYGAIVTSIVTPDRQGKPGEIALGFDSLDGYLAGHPFFGAIVGRYGNRIGGASFSLNGRSYALAANNGPASLHGGIKGFDKQLWSANSFSNSDGVGVTLFYHSPDGEEGYPGDLDAFVTYTLRADNALQIDYKVTAHGDTVHNLTNHSYFNLSGAPDILAHEAVIHASGFTPVDQYSIPLGHTAPVDGTPFDFRSAHTFGERINADNDQLRATGGYDHNFVIDGADGSLRECVRVHDPLSGRTLRALTTEPGVQVYCGNFIDGTLRGHGGAVYGKRSGFCLETQHWPDSPNQPTFPTTVLRAGQTYQSTTVYAFEAV